MSGTAWRNQNTPGQRSCGFRWGSYCFLLRWLLLCFFYFFESWLFFSLLLWFILFSLLTHILCFFWSLAIFLIASWLLSVLHLSVLYLSISLSVLPASVYLYISFPTPTISFFFFQSWRMQLIVRSVKPLRPVKTPRSHLASFEVIMNSADMLICTKPALLMKTQYWLPFIRLIMKYQYHLPLIERFSK